MQKNYVQEILNIIHGNIPQAELAEKLSDYHEKDLADALEALMPAERKSLYPILGVDEVAEIFAYLDDAEPYLKELDPERAARVISHMDSDDAVDALDDLEEDDKGEIVNKLDRDSIEDVKMLLSYSEDEIGSKMTTNYIRIKNDMTIRQAMSELVKQAGENDNISVLYVVDENEHFYGAIDLKDLIIARAEDPLAELIVGSYPYVTDREKISDCIERIVDYAERSLPVLNEAGKLMGIITSSDVVELVDDEMSDDYAKLGGLTSEEDLNEGVFESVKKRLPWLIILLFLGMGVSSTLSAGMENVFLDAYHQKEINSKQIFSGFSSGKSFLRIAGGMLWRTLWLFLWALFALIPIVGWVIAPIMLVIKGISYSFTPYLLLRKKDISPLDALKRSMEMTKGYRGKIFLTYSVMLHCLSLDCCYS